MHVAVGSAVADAAVMVVKAKGLVCEERVDEGLGVSPGAVEECICTLNWVANG